MNLTQTQKSHLCRLFGQALDVLSPEDPAPPSSQIARQGVLPGSIGIESKLAKLLEKKDLPAATVAFLKGLASFYETTGSLSERQEISLNGTYDAFFGPVA